jgi:hypothetical protein
MRNPSFRLAKYSLRLGRVEVRNEMALVAVPELRVPQIAGRSVFASKVRSLDPKPRIESRSLIKVAQKSS